MVIGSWPSWKTGKRKHDSHWKLSLPATDLVETLEALQPNERSTSSIASQRRKQIREAVERATHLLPSQGPITVFVHHNTLHAFEHLDFESAVEAASHVYSAEPYLTEVSYRSHLSRGRIREEDLDAVLQEDLGDEADRLVATFGTRYALRMAMLKYPLHGLVDQRDASNSTPLSPLIPDSSQRLRWIVAETDSLRRFREDLPDSCRREMLAEARRWYQQNGIHRKRDCANRSKNHANNRMQDRDLKDSALEAFYLRYLWQTSQRGVARVGKDDSSRTSEWQTRSKSDATCNHIRIRDLLFSQTGEDSDLIADDTLIRFSAAFLDQGFSEWDFSERSLGFYASFLKHYSRGPALTTWSSQLRNESLRLQRASLDPVESIDESIRLLGVSDEQVDAFVTRSLLVLRGWAGMVWQMETQADWAVRTAPSGSLLEFLAVRLILDRLAASLTASRSLGHRGSIMDLREQLTDSYSAMSSRSTEQRQVEQRAFAVFQLAQIRGWKPWELQTLSTEQWSVLVREIEAFDSRERRRIFHRAFERKFRNATLDAVVAHTRRLRVCADVSADVSPVIETESESGPPLFQMACCLDEREESFRRHLEEVQPACETFGIAGFFGVAMYYRGAGEAHFSPLCPVNVVPDHYVSETPVYSALEFEETKAEARRQLGHATHRVHRVSRSLVGGTLTGLFGTLAAFPLVARILLPRTTARVRRMFGSIVRTANTELRLERLAANPGNSEDQLGYSVAEMVAIVAGSLRAMGLVRAESFSKLFVICGHGSSSLNNPHNAAYNCGACGGGKGGPNARAFAQMANDVRVREGLSGLSINIPSTTHFIGAYHNTSDDGVGWYDLDRLPVTHRRLFEQVRSDIDEARQRNAHERCRRFESADLDFSYSEALRHVEGRSEDLSQTRPECGHATNALCFVGRRQWSRGLFLDRRAFLTSYDPTEDDDQNSILERTLQAVIPVCAGINLEYYFSYVDPQSYGCGTKLPHNITSLLGVMDGAASDLRPGLPWQMVEIHEPMRLLFLVESTPKELRHIMDRNEGIRRLVEGNWVQLACFDPNSGHVHRFVQGDFVIYAPHERHLPTVRSSQAWYDQQRDHLGFASVGSTSRLDSTVNFETDLDSDTDVESDTDKEQR